jgi:hypothetical protein
VRLPAVRRLFGTRPADGRAARQGSGEEGGTVTPYLLRYELPPGARAAGLEVGPAPGQDLPPEEILDRVNLFVADAAAAPGEPGSAATLGHTRLPGGGTLLCRTEARSVDGGGPAPWCVTACYLPGGEADLGGRLPVELWLDPFWEQQQAAAWPEEDDHPTWCDDAHLVEFAAAHADRLEPFLADVQRLFASPAGPQIVIAEHDPADVARWIALAGASLPYSTARSLTFLLRTDVPADAPHHIVGIGTEADFDRGDEVALRHLHRFHDGLGGPGSPPERGIDGWSQVAAQAWRRGIVPRSAPAGPEQAGPFAVGPLEKLLLPKGPVLHGVAAWAAGPGNEDAFGEAGRALLDHSTPRRDGEDSGLPGAAMATLPAFPPPVDALARERSAASPPGAAAVRQEGPRDGTGVSRVRPYAAASQARADAGAQPRSPALANLLAWLGVGAPAGADRHLVVALEGLAARPAEPDGEPGQDPRQLVRGQAVQQLCRAIDELQAEPPAEWGGLLEVLHALSPPTGRTAVTVPGAEAATDRERFDIKVAARLSRNVLDWEGRRDSPATRAMVERFPTPFTGLFLEQTAKADPGPRPARLLALAASPLGEWLGSVADRAPLRLRLVVEAHRLGETGAFGLPVFRGLGALLPAPADVDPSLHELAWWLAWHDTEPTATEAACVVRDLPAETLLRARLDHELAKPLTAPGPVADPLGELAHALLGMGAQLTDQQRAIAHVLDAGWRLTCGGITPAAAVAQMDALRNSGAIRQDLRTWFDTRLAAGLAAAGPAQLCDEAVWKRLGRALHEDLLLQYVEAQLAPANRQRLVSALEADHASVAWLFVVWSGHHQWCGSEWTSLAPRLVTEVLGDVAKRLRGDERDRIARQLGDDHGPEWTDAWRELIRSLPDPRDRAFGSAAAHPSRREEEPDTGHP